MGLSGRKLVKGVTIALVQKFALINLTMSIGICQLVDFEIKIVWESELLVRVGTGPENKARR